MSYLHYISVVVVMLFFVVTPSSASQYESLVNNLKKVCEEDKTNALCKCMEDTSAPGCECLAGEVTHYSEEDDYEDSASAGAVSSGGGGQQWCAAAVDDKGVYYRGYKYTRKARLHWYWVGPVLAAVWRFPRVSAAYRCTESQSTELQRTTCQMSDQSVAASATVYWRLPAFRITTEAATGATVDATGGIHVNASSVALIKCLLQPRTISFFSGLAIDWTNPDEADKYVHDAHRAASCFLVPTEPNPGYLEEFVK